MPLSNAEKCKNYRNRKKDYLKKKALKIKKKTSLTSAERSRIYRLRKKQLTQGIKSSVNEVLYTPSTSNSRMTLEPSPLPVTTESMSSIENPEMQENNTQDVKDDVNIKEEKYDLVIRIKPENEFNESTTNIDDDNPFQNIQVEIKQEEVQESHEYKSEIINKEISLNDAKDICHIQDTKTDDIGIKTERKSTEIISDDYPSQDEASMNSDDAMALHNVETCLQDDCDTKMANYEIYDNETNKIKEEMGLTVTETHLISNKLINTTSTVTVPCEGLIESETTKTLIMEIHPMSVIDTAIPIIDNPEVILPTSYPNQDEKGYEDFQLNSITSNILPLEQEAFGLLQTKKKKCLNNQYRYACPKCPKVYRLASCLRRHLTVHDSIERRAMGVLKGLQTRIERRNQNLYEKIYKETGKEKKNKLQQQVRKDRLEQRLQRIKNTELEKSKTESITSHDGTKVEIEVRNIKDENIKKEGYVCTCGQVFQRKSRMETCLRSHEPYADDSCFSCMSCSKQFKDKEELASHRKRLHRKRFPCKFCPTDYNTRKDLFKHLQIHQEVQLMEYKVISEIVKGKQKMKCFMCTKAYSELSDLKSHVMEDHGEPYICPHCKETFPKIIDFCNHTKTHHPEVQGQPVLDVLEAFSKLVKAWKCEECELQFHEADKLAKHQIDQHSPEIKTEAQFQCTDCHRMFMSQKGLTSHARIHHSLENCEESESTEKGVMCVECRKICKDMDALTSHMRLHSPERKYPCKFCDFRFTTPEKRKAHSEIHTGDMKFVCFICEYQCSSENRLKQHKMSLKHANMKEFLLTGKPLIEEESSTSTKRETSSKESDVKRRKRDKESLSSEDEEEIMCDVCGEKFSSKKRMLKHKNKHPFIEFPNEDTPTRIFFK